MPLGDLVALKLQELHRHAEPEGGRPLLRIDNAQDAARAPFQFDAASGRLHRRSCRSIAAPARLALYGVWRIGPHERQLACERCRPMQEDEKPDQRGDAAELLFGFLSIVTQFGSVLRERGREYRNSSEGREIGARIDAFYKGLGRREQDILSTVLGSLDGLVRQIRDLDSGLDGMNGHGNGQSNGHDPGRREED